MLTISTIEIERDTFPILRIVVDRYGFFLWFLLNNYFWSLNPKYVV